MNTQPLDPHKANHREALPPEVEALLQAEAAGERDGLREAWHLAANARAAEPSDERIRAMGEAMLLNLNAALDAEAGKPKMRLLQFRPALTYWAAAACFVALFAFGINLYLKPVSLVAEPGSIASATLPDGSTVRLNAGSRISYTRGLHGKVRAVNLEGEALFDVQKGARPFVVKTFNAEVTVLGTRFNVRAWSKERLPETDVVLVRGAVELASLKNRAQKVHLNPGSRSAVIDNDTRPTKPEAINASGETNWVNGGLAFHNQPLSEILDELERRFDVRILTQSEELELPTLTLIYDQPAGVEAVIKDICSYLNYQYRPVAGGYEIYMTADK